MKVPRILYFEAMVRMAPPYLFGQFSRKNRRQCRVLSGARPGIFPRPNADLKHPFARRHEKLEHSFQSVMIIGTGAKCPARAISRPSGECVRDDTLNIVGRPPSGFLDLLP